MHAWARRLPAGAASRKGTGRGLIRYAAGHIFFLTFPGGKLRPGRGLQLVGPMQPQTQIMRNH